MSYYTELSTDEASLVAGWWLAAWTNEYRYFPGPGGEYDPEVSWAEQGARWIYDSLFPGGFGTESLKHFAYQHAAEDFSRYGRIIPGASGQGPLSNKWDGEQYAEVPIDYSWPSIFHEPRTSPSHSFRDGFEVPDNKAVWELGDSFAFEVWIIPTGFEGNQSLWSGPNGAAHIYINPSGNVVLGEKGGAEVCSSAFPLEEGLLHHIVVQKDAGGGKIFIDKVNVTSTVGNPTLTGSEAPWFIGKNGTEESEFLHAYVQHAFLWSSPLSAERIAAHYDAGLEEGEEEEEGEGPPTIPPVGKPPWEPPTKEEEEGTPKEKEEKEEEEKEEEEKEEEEKAKEHVRRINAGDGVAMDLGSMIDAAFSSESSDQTFVAYVKLDHTETAWFISFAATGFSGAGSWTSYGQAGVYQALYPPGQFAEANLPPEVWCLAVCSRDHSGDTTFFLYDLEKDELVFEGIASEGAWAWFEEAPDLVQLGRWNAAEQLEGLFAAAALFTEPFDASRVEDLAHAALVMDWKSEPGVLALWLLDQATGGADVLDLVHDADSTGVTQPGTFSTELVTLPLRLRGEEEEGKGREALVLSGGSLVKAPMYALVSGVLVPVEK